MLFILKLSSILHAELCKECTCMSFDKYLQCIEMYELNEQHFAF